MPRRRGRLVAADTPTNTPDAVLTKGYGTAKRATEWGIALGFEHGAHPAESQNAAQRLTRMGAKFVRSIVVERTGA